MKTPYFPRSLYCNSTPKCLVPWTVIARPFFDVCSPEVFSWTVAAQFWNIIFTFLNCNSSILVFRLGIIYVLGLQFGFSKDQLPLFWWNAPDLPAWCCSPDIAFLILLSWCSLPVLSSHDVARLNDLLTWVIVPFLDHIYNQRFFS